VAIFISRQRKTVKIKQTINKKSKKIKMIKINRIQLKKEKDSNQIA